MDDKIYYEFLAKATGGDVSGVGYVVGNKVPFKQASSAIKFVRSAMPAVTPDDGMILKNKEKCAELARAIRPELERLKMELDAKNEEARKKLDTLAAQRDSIEEKSLYDQVQKEVLHERVIEQIGYCSALHAVWQMLSDRAWELYECGRMK